MAKPTKPNILVIWGDDIGIWNLSCYHRGLLGGRTPNIDRIAAEGALFTDCYGQQSCTAGRAAFITGQHPFRTGLLKVGLPGAELGLRPEDPTIAVLLKNHGYATGQFGKNHLGDRNEYLPTVHGFDGFFGNLYHLNAEEEPEDPQYPQDPRFKQRFGPRGALHCKATDVDDPTVDPRFGRIGKQTIEDTGRAQHWPLRLIGGRAFMVARDPYLDAALEEARRGLVEGGIPIGSVIVHRGAIIGRGHNRRVQKGSPTLHGEMDALENAGRQPAHVYRESVLYTTLSPCAMCSGAILLYGIPTVVVGENRTFLGEEELLRSRGVDVQVLQDLACIELMRDFIASRPELWNEDIGEP